jgi:predicted dithiol-disulfide oxidoreductase (DUF899 family)
MQLKSIALHVDGDVPQLWPDNADPDYVRARHALAEAEAALRDHVAEVARMRHELPPGPQLQQYEFVEGPRNLDVDEPVRRVTLLELFGDHDTLVVYHLMFHPDDDQACPMCSLWIDGLHGVSHHLAQRTAFVVVAKAPVEKLRSWARHRGWRGLRIVSSGESSFNPDMHVEGVRGGQWPAVSVFRRDGEHVRHVLTQSAEFPDGSARGIDLLSPVWNVFDLLPQGRGDWFPDNDYPGATRG